MALRLAPAAGGIVGVVWAALDGVSAAASSTAQVIVVAV